VLHPFVISGSWGIHLAVINSICCDVYTNWKGIRDIYASAAERNDTVSKILSKEEESEE
jgi:hypothetical protein